MASLDEYGVGQEVEVLRSNGSWEPGRIEKIVVRITLKDGTTKEIPADLMPKQVRLMQANGSASLGLPAASDKYSIDQDVEVLRSNGSWSFGVITAILPASMTVTLKDGSQKAVPTELMHSHVRPMQSTGSPRPQVPAAEGHHGYAAPASPRPPPKTAPIEAPQRAPASPRPQQAASAPAQAADVGDAGDGWAAATLKSHNDLRARHGAPPLKWSKECEQKAQMAANNCAAKNAVFHNNHQEYGHGQNIFYGTGKEFSANDAVEKWYSEVKTPGYHNWSNPNSSAGTGHFTQLVWKDCLEVGMSRDSYNKGFIVANYWPAGNMQGNFDQNVFREGTPMQTRKLVRREAYSKTDITRMDADLQSVLDSIPQRDIATQVVEKLNNGWSLKIDYKPAPNGSCQCQFKKSGSTMSTMASF